VKGDIDIMDFKVDNEAYYPSSCEAPGATDENTRGARIHTPGKGGEEKGYQVVIR